MDWHITIPFFERVIHLEGIRLMVIGYVVVFLAWMFIWHTFLQRQIPLRLATALKDILPFALVAAGAMVVTYFLTKSIGNIYILLIARIFIAAALYLGIIWRAGAKILRESVEFIKRRKK